jgi:magnesium-transporting ATPase (P-type)
LHGKKPETGEEQKTAKSTSPDEIPELPESREKPSPVISERMEEFGKRMENSFTRTRAGRVTGYSASIFWNVILLIFFSFFHQYIAWYHVQSDGSVTGLSMLTGDYFTWLPILVTALVISIAANIIMIIYDRFWFREIIQIILTVIGVVVVANLISIFPFDFSVIPSTTAVDIVPVVVTIALIIIAVGLGVGALVRFIKLIVNVAKQSAS